MAFDRYMIHVGAGAHPKLRELTVLERYTFFLGVLSLAARAHPRGSLQIGGHPVGWQDVARECSVRGQVANRTLAKLRQIGMIEASDGGTEWVHDWNQWNPEPRSDATNAERQARYRKRRRNGRNASLVTLRNAGEVEVEEEGPPSPLSRNGALVPEIPAWLENNTARELQHRGEPVTAQAIRSLLIERP